MRRRFEPNCLWEDPSSREDLNVADRVDLRHEIVHLEIGCYGCYGYHAYDNFVVECCFVKTMMAMTTLVLVVTKMDVPTSCWFSPATQLSFLLYWLNSYFFVHLNFYYFFVYCVVCVLSGQAAVVVVGADVLSGHVAVCYTVWVLDPDHR